VPASVKPTVTFYIYIYATPFYPQKLALTSPTSGGSVGMVSSRTKAIELVSYIYKQTPWPESGGELYRPSHRRLPAKLMSTCADTWSA
jgi:hypothetical protein